VQAHHSDKLHSDVHKDHAEEELKQINETYEVLSNLQTHPQRPCAQDQLAACAKTDSS